MTKRRRLAVSMAIAVLALTVSACAAGTASSTPSNTTPANTPTPSGSDASVQPEPQASEEPQTGAADAFRAWVEASRLPDVETACAGLAPDLATRMIAELNAGGVTGVETCEQMIAAAAELYRAVGDDGSVDIDVQQETATDATLFVTYAASGDCCTVVMSRAGTDWIITNESRECAG